MNLRSAQHHLSGIGRLPPLSEGTALVLNYHNGGNDEDHNSGAEAAKGNIAFCGNTSTLPCALAKTRTSSDQRCEKHQPPPPRVVKRAWVLVGTASAVIIRTSGLNRLTKKRKALPIYTSARLWKFRYVEPQIITTQKTVKHASKMPKKRHSRILSGVHAASSTEKAAASGAITATRSHMGNPDNGASIGLSLSP